MYIDGFFDYPNAILNLDESAFKLGEDFSHCYSLRRERYVYAVKKGSDPTQITVVAAGFASGRTLITFFLYNRSTSLASWFDSASDKVLSAYNDSGYIDCKILLEYAEEEIFPSMKPGKVNFAFWIISAIFFSCNFLIYFHIVYLKGQKKSRGGGAI